MPRQRTRYSRITYTLPEDFPQRLKQSLTPQTQPERPLLRGNQSCIPLFDDEQAVPARPRY